MGGGKSVYFHMLGIDTPGEKNQSVRLIMAVANAVALTVNNELEMSPEKRRFRENQELWLDITVGGVERSFVRVVAYPLSITSSPFLEPMFGFVACAPLHHLGPINTSPRASPPPHPGPGDTFR